MPYSSCCKRPPSGLPANCKSYPRAASPGASTWFTLSDHHWILHLIALTKSMMRSTFDKGLSCLSFHVRLSISRTPELNCDHCCKCLPSRKYQIKAAIYWPPSDRCPGCWRAPLLQTAGMKIACIGCWADMVLSQPLDSHFWSKLILTNSLSSCSASSLKSRNHCHSIPDWKT